MLEKEDSLGLWNMMLFCGCFSQKWCYHSFRLLVFESASHLFPCNILKCSTSTTASSLCNKNLPLSFSVVWNYCSCSSIDNRLAVAEPEASNGSYCLAQYLHHVSPLCCAGSTGEADQGRSTAMARLSHNMYPNPLWMIMTKCGLAVNCVFSIRRLMILRNQADTEQMLNWSTFLVWGKRIFSLFQRCSLPGHPNYLQLVCVSMLDVPRKNLAPVVKIVIFL